MTIDLSNADAIMAQLVESWCDRRALRLLRQLLMCYPRGSGLTDEWEDLATCFKTIRMQYGNDLAGQELEQIIGLQHLAESIVFRQHVA